MAQIGKHKKPKLNNVIKRYMKDGETLFSDEFSTSVAFLCQLKTQQLKMGGFSHPLYTLASSTNKEFLGKEKFPFYYGHLSQVPGLE